MHKAPSAPGQRRARTERGPPVTNLTPTGAEPHDFELDPDDIDRVLDADVVFELGHGFQPAVEHAADQRDGPTVELLSNGTRDPHIWLDLVRRATTTCR